MLKISGESLMGKLPYGIDPEMVGTVAQQVKDVVATGVVPFAIFLIAATAELNRPPFDLVEAEQELVGGFNTEYSSIRFALFFLAEFMNTITMSALIVTLFFGGPQPIAFGSTVLDIPLIPNALEGTLWLFLKTLVFLYTYVWLRATLPRFRYDQLMDFGWKILIPVSILWILVVATLRTLSLEGAPRVVVVGFASFVVLLVMAANIGFENAKKKKLESLEVEVSEPTFAVPTVPMNVSNINVSQSSKGGDHV